MARGFYFFVHLLAGLGALLTCTGCFHQVGFFGPDHKERCQAGGMGCCPQGTGATQADPDALENQFQNFVPSPCVTPPYLDNPGPYQGLTERECQCQAARASSMANLLEGEEKAIEDKENRTCIPRGKKSKQKSAFQEVLLTDSALEMRNQSAGEALLLYYGLAEAQAKKPILDDALRQIGDALRKSKERQTQGLPLPVEHEVLHRQQIELQAQQTQLYFAIQRLNKGLARLLGPDRCQAGGQFWPVGPLENCTETVTIEAAVAEGLEQRPELVLLRFASAELNAATLPVVRQMLQSINPLLSMAAKTAAFPQLAKALGHLQFLNLDEAELEARRRQLDQYRADREQQVAENIRQAAAKLQTQAQLVILARENVHSWESKIKELENKPPGTVSYAEMTSAVLEHAKARQEVVKEAAAWEVARVMLKEEQGILILECGYTTAGSCTAPSSGRRTSRWRPKPSTLTPP